MDPIRTAALVVALPGAVALAVALGARGWRHGASVAVATAAVAGAWAVLGAPALWPVDVSQRFFHVIAAGLFAAIAGALPGVAGHAGRSLGALVAIGLVLGPLFSHRFAGVWSVVAAGAAVATLAIVWLGLDRAGRRGDRAGLLIAAIAAAGAGASAGLSGSVVIAQLGVAAAAGLGALWLVSLVRAEPSYLLGAAPLVAVIVWAVLALSVLYASMTAAVAVAVLAIPVLAAIVRVLLPAHARKASVACAVILAAAAALMAHVGAGEQSPESDDDYGYGYE